MAKRNSASTQPRELRISRNAYLNILDITHYIAVEQHSSINAEKVSTAIFAAIERIGQTPFSYKECEYISTKTKIYRQANCISWLIFYKVIETEVIILGVLHQANNPSKLKELKKIK
jgi:plasmid stabilization system protein ParE